MSGARRAYDILRGYVSHGWDQLSNSEEDQAQRELREAIENPAPRPNSSVSSHEPDPTLSLEQARNLFDLASNATSKQIEEAYEGLRTATDMSKFQEGSEAWQRARILRRRIDIARQILLENMDPTVRRFERLEIE